jgi:hypothetical protein
MLLHAKLYFKQGNILKYDRGRAKKFSRGK